MGCKCKRLTACVARREENGAANVVLVGDPMVEHELPRCRARFDVAVDPLEFEGGDTCEPNALIIES